MLDRGKIKMVIVGQSFYIQMSIYKYVFSNLFPVKNYDSYR